MRLSGLGVREIADAGFESVSLDLNLLYPAAEFEQIMKSGNIRNKKDVEIWGEPKRIVQKVDSVLEKYRGAGLGIKLLRAPYFSRNIEMCEFLIREYEGGNNSLFHLLLRINIECINLCSMVNCRKIVIPPVCFQDNNKTGQKMNREYYNALSKAAAENHVMILLENQYLNFNGNLIRGTFSDSGRAVEFINRLNAEAGQEIYGFCMDVGVCSLCGQDMREYLLPLGKYIKSVIIRDCDGQNDGALLPFTCVGHGRSKTDWLSLVRGLREIMYNGQLVFDMKDTAEAFRPLLTLPFLRFAKTVADYFAWQISIEDRLKNYRSIVLFGAGNMCRDFMKCYGDKYPPLFVCDNNSVRWGTLFCGLEIRPPDVLSDIPDDYGVFICNIYYNEIAAQLKEMEVRNIEFFSNEYMPSYYFDNLEMWKDDKDRSTDKGCVE